MKPCSSSSSSRSTRCFSKSDFRPIVRLVIQCTMFLLGGSFALRFKNAGDSKSLPLPFLGFRDERLSAVGGEQIVLGAAIVFCSSPLRLHAACPLQPAERRKQRTGIDAKYAFAGLLNAKSHTIAVHGLKGQSLQDEHLQGSLYQVAWL